jgi:presenilin-like A22 family membrane protease
MKHKASVTLILLSMFILTQLIGLFVINAYTPIEVTNPTTGNSTTIKNDLPFGLETPEDEPTPNFISLVFSFILAFVLISILIKYKWKTVMRIWFFCVIALALGISINAFLKLTTLEYISIIAIVIAIPLAFLKIFKPNVYVHNSTELLIYPGIAAIFVPILTPLTIILLLLLISLYDAWAVWQSGIMQKMAKFQMDELKVFGGFFIPTASDKVKKEIKTIKEKYKGKKIPKKIKNKKFKVNLAILGGGDVIFPIITAGVFMRAFGITPAIFIILGSLAGLLSIFLFSQKGKAYPAMPYITTGILASLLIWKILPL